MSRRQQSPAASASAALGTTLRPRTRRLISIEGDDGEGTTIFESAPTSSNQPLRNAVDSAFSSARRSPAPSPHPSRATSRTRSSPQQLRAENARSWGLSVPLNPISQQDSKSPGLWSSWTSLQNVASTLLGSNIQPSTPTGGKRKAKHGRNYSLAVPEEPWGPSGNPADLIASGSQEERLAKVQAEKRRALLAGAGDEQRDTLGRYKRRSSLDKMDSIPSPTHDDDALVYLHHVQPADSVAGLSIRYSCTQAMVRKSNRLWPSDSIHLRKIAFLPVDACSIRGKKVSSPGPSNASLFTKTEDGTAGTRLNGRIDADYHIASSLQTTTPPSKAEEERPWIHDSWVILPFSDVPVEIGRMPRRTLGFFPPARRKSAADYSDSSPPRSLADLEHSPSNAASSLGNSTRTSPGRGYSPARRPLMARASRSNSATSKLLNPHARLAASNFLRGPGGVGSLHSSVHGPAPDELNRFVAQHMPQLIIQEAMDVRVGEFLAGSGIAGGGAPADPRLSFDRLSTASGSTAGVGVEAVAGAVEGWMRKVGGRVKESLGTPEMRGRGRGPGAGDGDLIELVEGWDLNGPPGSGSDLWESEGHGVSPAGESGKGKGRMRGTSGTGASVGVGTGTKDEEALLRERFPPVGKIFEEQTRKKA